MAMERKRMELALSGSSEPLLIRAAAAPDRAQTVPPLPPTPEFLNQKNSASANTRIRDIPISGPSSVSLDEPANIVFKESPSAKPSPSPPFIFPPPSRPSEGSMVAPASPRISCEGWVISELCRKYPNFHEVRRVKASTVSEDLSRIMEEYETVGNPLIVEGWHEHPGWRQDLLNLDWLLAEVGDKEMHVRNVHNRRDFSLNLPTFVEMCRKQALFHEPGEAYRCYWKDAECPLQWKEWLGTILPPELLPGCSGDLLRHLYPSEAVESLMCYLGMGDTYTAAHKDICSSSGHNLMCFSENGGSAFWFMTESKDASKAAEYFQKVLGQELDWEIHVTTLEELGNAPFDVYVAEQKVGDLVLVPPRSVHQVVNHGGLAMKTSWSRMTLQGLKTALHSELPVYRRVCRPEQYRIKTVLYRTMLHHTESLQSSLTFQATVNDTNGSLVGTNTLDLEYTSDKSDSGYELPSTPSPPPTTEQRADTLRSLVGLFDEVLLEESGWSVTTETSMRRKVVLVPPSDPRDPMEKQQAGTCNFACDFCGADIFQSFFECRACAGLLGQSTQPGDGFLVCPACYVEGRSCECDEMEPVQCRPLDALITARNRAAEVLRQVAATSNIKAPLELHESDLNKHKDIRVFEAACAYRDLKRKRYADDDRQCRATKSDMHTSPASACLRCPVCKIYKCFPHFLRADTHVAEAVLAFSKDKDDLHTVHRDNNLRRKHSPLRLYNVRGSELKTRLTIAAKSFPRCKPWHTKMRVGFYDTEFALDSEPDEEPSPPPPTPSCSDSRGSPRHIPPQLNLSATSLQLLDEGETSPLTSLDSESPERPATAALCPEESHRIWDEPEELIVSVDKPDVLLDLFGDPVDSNQHRSPSVSPTATAVDATSEVEISEIVNQLDLPRMRKARQNKAYVEIPRQKLHKRTVSSSSSDLEWVDEPQPKKSRPTHQRAGEKEPRAVRGRSASRAEPQTTRPSASRKSKARGASEDDFVEASYGPDLACALSKAVAVETPVLSQPRGERPSGPLPRRSTAAKRIVPPHLDNGASPIRLEPSNPTTQPPPALISPRPSSSMNAPRPLPRVKQPALSTSNKLAPPRPSKLPAAPANADVDMSRPPKRKRGNPPGIPHDQMDANMASRRREPRSRSPRKKARVAQRPDPEVIVIEDEPVPMTVSRCRSPTPASRMTGLNSSSSRPLLLLPPPQLSKPRNPTPPTNVAGPSHVGNSGRRAPSVEHQAGPHPSDDAPPPVLNLAAPSVPPLVSKFAPEPAAGSASASSSASAPVLVSTQAYPPLALAVQPGTTHANLAQRLAALNNNYAPLPESNPAPSNATSLQPVESNDLKAMSSVLGLAATAFASAATMNEKCQQVMQTYDSVRQRLDDLEVRTPSVAQRQPSVDDMAQLLARMERMEEALEISEDQDKKLARREEEVRQLRDQLQREHSESEKKIAQMYEEARQGRQERHHMAVRVRQLEGEVETLKASLADCVKKEALPEAVGAAVSSSMLPLRTSVEDMVVRAVEKQGALLATTSLPAVAEQRPADLPPHLSQDGPAGDIRLQLDGSRQAPQPHPGQPPWHGAPNVMYGPPPRHGNMSCQPPRAQIGQQFGGNHQYNHDQRRGGYQRGGFRNGGHSNYSTHRHPNDRHQDPYNNWHGPNRPEWPGRPETRQWDRGPYAGEAPIRNGHQHEEPVREPVRDQPRRDSPARGRSVDVRSEHSSASSHREHSCSAARSYSRSTERDQTSSIHQLDDTPRDVDKPGPSTSNDTIEDHTSENSQQSRSDIQESSSTQKVAEAAIQSATQPAYLAMSHGVALALVLFRVAVPRRAIVLGLSTGPRLRAGPDAALQCRAGPVIVLHASLHLVMVLNFLSPITIASLGLVTTLAILSPATRHHRPTVTMGLPVEDPTFTSEADLSASSASLSYYLLIFAI
ncbi:transcription factor [Ganoderma sinense ZZ0214-1]|uniref:Transcription factor n=1 Tax=Ganoderma sinense ZZ0214-1 TaxID=1077348 RepID=A0A2G8RR40_9APHY|nr:transcription factor [Ganoderma sinense ZZ0214-1]